MSIMSQLRAKKSQMSPHTARLLPLVDRFARHSRGEGSDFDLDVRRQFRYGTL
jgi:hypothetical protein